MTIPTPKKPYDIELARNKDTSEEIPFLFTVHTSIPISSFQNSTPERGWKGFANDIVDRVPGVDLLEAGSPYSFRVAVARCFDIKEVQDAIIELVKIGQSDIDVIVGPRLVT